MDQPNLNMRQRRWIDVVSDYECEVLYHPGKANIVTDSLSRREVSTSIRDLCLRMKIVSLVLEMIRDAKSKAIKEEN